MPSREYLEGRKIVEHAKLGIPKYFPETGVLAVCDAYGMVLFLFRVAGEGVRACAFGVGIAGRMYERIYRLCTDAREKNSTFWKSLSWFVERGDRFFLKSVRIVLEGELLSEWPRRVPKDVLKRIIAEIDAALALC